MARKAFSFADLKIGSPKLVGHLACFPIWGNPRANLDYILIEDGMENKEVLVEEVSENGVVSELRVTNFSDKVVFVLDGTELKGAKQNRIVNASILLEPKSATTIPVSCVEEGRWHFEKVYCEKSSFAALLSIRSTTAEFQKAALGGGMGYASDQQQIWNMVADYSDKLGADSPTGALHDVYEKREQDIGTYKKGIKLEGVETGAAFFVGGRFLGLDIFDRPGTLASVFERLIGAAAMEALASDGVLKPENPDKMARKLRSILNEAARAHFEAYKVVGIGDDLRYEGKEAFGKALYYEGDLVHFAAFGNQAVM